MPLRSRVAALLVALVVGAAGLVAVPLASPASAHGGVCDAHARKPKFVDERTVKVSGWFSCPKGHQKMTITVELWVRFSGRAWEKWLDETKSRSGGTRIALSFEATYFCDHHYKTVVRGLAGSSGTKTHSKKVTSPVLRANCA